MGAPVIASSSSTVSISSARAIGPVAVTNKRNFEQEYSNVCRAYKVVSEKWQKFTALGSKENRGVLVANSVAKDIVTKMTLIYKAAIGLEQDIMKGTKNVVEKSIKLHSESSKSIADNIIFQSTMAELQQGHAKLMEGLKSAKQLPSKSKDSTVNMNYVMKILELEMLQFRDVTEIMNAVVKG